MKGLSQYGAVATKIRGMRSHLLKDEEYEYLANCPSVADMVIYLKSHPAYAEALANLDVSNMRREVMERLLTNTVLRDIEKISHFLDNRQKKFLEVYKTFFELRFLNNCLRIIFNKYTDISDMSVYRPMFEHSKNLNFDAVTGAKDIHELIEALDGTIYYAPLHKTYELLDNPELFDYETAFTRFYFSNFWNELEKFHSSYDMETLLNVHGEEIDLLNIIWIYRTKSYYNVSVKDIYRYVIPAQHKLKQSQLVDMAQADTPEEVLQLVRGTYYKKYIDDPAYASLDEAYTQAMDNLNSEIRLKYPYSFAVIESYIHDKRAEAEKIIHIGESIRYGYDPQLIMKVLKIGAAK